MSWVLYALLGYFIIGACFMTFMWFAVGRHVPPNPQVPAHLTLLILGSCWIIAIPAWVWMFIRQYRKGRP